MQSPVGNPSPNRFVLVAAILILGTIGLFWPTTGFDFVGYDDPVYVTQNSHVQAGLTADGLKWAFGNVASDATYWHPLSWMSHMLDCQLFGLNAGAHHRTSIFFHALNAVLCFLLVWKLTGGLWRSAAVAALFAWHPLQVESVAWVTERKNLLSTMFFFLTLLAYLRYARNEATSACAEDCIWTRTQKRITRPDYLLVVFLFILGLMSKPMLVTIPCVLLLLDFWPLKRTGEARDIKSWTPLLLEKAPLFFLSVISSWITVLAHRKLDMMASDVPFSIRIANAALSYVRYIEKTFWPADLAAIYPYPAVWPVTQFIATVIVLLIITAMVYTLRKNHTYLLFGWCWFLGTLVPVIGLVQAGSQAMADRFIYIPIIGLLIAICGAAAELFRKIGQEKVAASVVVPAVLIACLVVSNHQLQYWRNSMTLFTRCIAVTRDNVVAHYNLGYAYALQKNLAKAKHHYNEALRISPKYIDARNNLAGALVAEGQLNEAAAEYKKVLELAPKHPLAHYNLGIVLEQQNKLSEALPHFEIVANTMPHNIEAHLKTVNTLGRMGKETEAFERVEMMLKANTKSAEAHFQAGKVYLAQQNSYVAQQEFEAALELDPNHLLAHYELGNIYGMLGKIPEAIPHFQKVVEARPDFTQAQFALGATLVSQGKAEQALQHYRKAVASDPTYAPALFNLGWVLSTHQNDKVRNGKEALELARKMVEMTKGEDPAAFDLLGAAQAEVGNFPEAITAIQKAMQLAGNTAQPKQIDELKSRLQLYQQQRSYRAL